MHALPASSLRVTEYSAVGSRQKQGLLALIVGVHLMVAWGLQQLGSVRLAVAEVIPLAVNIVSPPAPLPPAPATPPPPPTVRPTLPPMIVPEVTVSAPPTPVITVAPAPVPAPAPEPVVVRTPVPAAPAAPALGPKMLPPSAIQYLVTPQVDYPRASRRAREQGTVVIRVLVDEAGLPAQVQISQSSGFARLDEAGVAAVRAARFKPYIQDGQAMAGWALIPLSFNLEN